MQPFDHLLLVKFVVAHATSYLIFRFGHRECRDFFQTIWTKNYRIAQQLISVDVRNQRIVALLPIVGITAQTSQVLPQQLRPSLNEDHLPQVHNKMIFEKCLPLPPRIGLENVSEERQYFFLIGAHLLERPTMKVMHLLQLVDHKQHHAVQAFECHELVR